MATTNRIKAINWWSFKSDIYRDALVHTYYQGRNEKSLTGREIENIWVKETQSKRY